MPGVGVMVAQRPLNHEFSRDGDNFDAKRMNVDPGNDDDIGNPDYFYLEH